MLWYSVERTGHAKFVDEVIVATSIEKNNDQIYNYCEEKNIKCYRGNENDVLDRYYQVAVSNKADTIVRITADCPLIDPEIIDRTIKEFLDGNYDYTRTAKTWPNGIGSVEVTSFKVLEEIWKKAKLPGEREHVTPYIYTHPEIFKMKVIECIKNYSDIVLSVDTLPQFNAVKNIIENLEKKDIDFGMSEIFLYLGKNPAILKSIKGIERRGPEQYTRDFKSKVKK